MRRRSAMMRVLTFRFSETLKWDDIKNMNGYLYLFDIQVPNRATGGCSPIWHSQNKRTTSHYVL